MTLKALNDRVKWWMDTLRYLGISHYEYTVAWSETPHDHEDAAAAVEIEDDYDRFALEFSRAWMEEHTEEEQDEVIVHELLHVVLKPLQLLHERTISTLSYDARSLLEALQYSEMERAVRRLATQIIHIT